jgi:hypothetical protein
MRPLMTSAYGDVFLQGEDGVLFLDTVEGKLTREWDSTNDLQHQRTSGTGRTDTLREAGGFGLVSHPRASKADR